MKKTDTNNETPKRSNNFITVLVYIVGIIGGLYFFGLLGVIIFILAIGLGMSFPGWYIRKGYSKKFISILVWSNLITWLIPILGLFTGVAAIEFSKYQEGGKFNDVWVAGIVGVTLSIAYSLFAIDYFGLK